MKQFVIITGLVFFSHLLKAQTSGNTNPGSINSSDNQQQMTPPTGTSSAIPPSLPNTGDHLNPVGTHGTDMTNPNHNGSYENNPDGKPKDNFQANPNLTPAGDQQPRPQ